MQKAPTLYVLRGLPGSGKSRVAQKLAQRPNTVVCTVDDYFCVDGKYVFDPYKLQEYHERNFERARSFMAEGKNIVIDNPNILKCIYRPYVFAASRYGYSVVIRTIGQPKDPESWHTCFLRNIHDVPKSAIRRMGEQFEV